MELSSKVPGELRKALREYASDLNPNGDIELWAVHQAAARFSMQSEQVLSWSRKKLAVSRSILKNFGNMSSATVMFVMEQLMRTATPGQRGCGISFGPGLTAETMSFHVA